MPVILTILEPLASGAGKCHGPILCIGGRTAAVLEFLSALVLSNLGTTNPGHSMAVATKIERTIDHPLGIVNRPTSKAAILREVVGSFTLSHSQPVQKNVTSLTIARRIRCLSAKIMRLATQYYHVFILIHMTSIYTCTI